MSQNINFLIKMLSVSFEEKNFDYIENISKQLSELLKKYGKKTRKEHLWEVSSTLLYVDSSQKVVDFLCSLYEEHKEDFLFEWYQNVFLKQENVLYDKIFYKKQYDLNNYVSLKTLPITLSEKIFNFILEKQINDDELFNILIDTRNIEVIKDLNVETWLKSLKKIKPKLDLKLSKKIFDFLKESNCFDVFLDTNAKRDDKDFSELIQYINLNQILNNIVFSDKKKNYSMFYSKILHPSILKEIMKDNIEPNKTNVLIDKITTALLDSNVIDFLLNNEQDLLKEMLNIGGEQNKKDFILSLYRGSKKNILTDFLIDFCKDNENCKLVYENIPKVKRTEKLLSIIQVNYQINEMNNVFKEGKKNTFKI